MTEGQCVDILRRMSRILGAVFKVFATLFGIIALLVMIAAWRMAFVPIHTTALTPYLVGAFTRFLPDMSTEIAGSTLDWDNRKQLLTLSLDGLEVKGPDGSKVATFKTASLKLRLWHLLSGGILPQELSVQEARFWLVRDTNGLISFAAANQPAEVKTDSTGKALNLTLLQFMSDEIANTKLRHNLSLKDAVFIVHDQITTQDWTVKVPEVSLAHDKKEAKGFSRIELTENERTSTLQTTYDFDYVNKLHNVSLAFQDIKPSAFAAKDLNLTFLKIADFPVSGTVSVSSDRALNIARASVKLVGGKGALNERTMWDKPRTIESLDFQAAYDKSKDQLLVEKAEINFGGPRLNLTLDAVMPPPKDLLWLSHKHSNGFILSIALDDLPMDQFGEVWPKTIIPDARNWIVASMSKGIFTHGDVTIRGKADVNDLANVTIESGGGKVSAKDGVIKYLNGMPSIDDSSAEATFDLDHMDVKILTGHTGGVKIRPFTLVIDKFQEDIQHIMIPLDLVGPVKEVLKILDSPILGYATAIGLSPDDSVGQVEGILTLRMPLLDALLLKDVDVRALAKITDFGSQKLVSGIELSQGNLALDLTKDGFGLKGSVGMNKVPAQLVWKTNFGENRKASQPIHEGTIAATLKGDQWGAFYGLDSLAKIQGETPVTIKYTNLKKGMSRVEGQVALKQASVQLRDIGWNKPSGVAAQVGFTLDINQGKNLQFKTIDLEGQGIKVKGTAELDDATGKLVALKFNPFILGRSNATVSYSRPMDTRTPLLITLDGESFDMNGLEDKDKTAAEVTPEAEKKASEDPEATRPKEYVLKLVKLYTSDDGFMASMKGHALRDQIGWKEIDLWGVAQGQTPVAIKLLPEGGRLIFNMSADNFGNALQGMGFGKGVKSGKIEISGESTPADPRTIVGKLKIDSFVVTDLPVLARLLSAVSPFGFLDMLTGDASFDHLLGHYRWHGDDVDFSEMRASGSVVGINVEGRLNTASGNANLSGTLVPFSFMNSIIGYIPLLGDVITGGSGGGIIAASFKVSGKLSDPKISVNPVSLLTPGILRSIFFSNGETGADVKPVKEPAKPVLPALPEVKPQSNINKGKK